MADDHEIRDRVLQELDFDPLVEDTDIGVTVKHGAVALHGSVTSLPAKRAAIAAAQRVKGVLTVADEISVHLPGQHTADDEEIARKVSNVMQWNVSLPDEGVDVTVEEGRVTITGSVDSEAQKRLIEEQVGFVRGVRGVENRLTVRRRTDIRDIAERIEAALHRRASLDAGKIKVTVDGDRVRLEGRVRDAAERRLIEEAVWASTDISILDDRLTVGFR